MSNLLWWEFVFIVVPVYWIGVFAGYSYRKAKSPKNSEGGGDEN